MTKWKINPAWEAAEYEFEFDLTAVSVLTEPHLATVVGSRQETPAGCGEARESIMNPDAVAGLKDKPTDSRGGSQSL